MVGVDIEQHLHAHAEVASDLGDIDTPLHEPGRRRVAQDVGRVSAGAACLLSNSSPRPFELLDRLTLVVDDAANALGEIFLAPLAQVWKQSPVNLGWRLPFLGPLGTVGPAMQD